MMRWRTLTCFMLCGALAALAACNEEKKPGPSVGSAPVKKPQPPAGKPAAEPGGGGAKIDPSKFPATEAGAKALLKSFFDPKVDRVALSLALKPKSADYRAVFTKEEVAAKAEKAYESLWKIVKRRPIGPKAGQTELLLWEATTDDLKAGTGNARKFPGGYKRVAKLLKSGLKVYRFKFVRPGEKLGMAFDGLYNLGGRWVLMPKPWRALR